MEVFLELSIILFIAMGISLLMKILKQPLLVGYILTGIIVGPNFLNILASQDELKLFSKIGIVVLLFIVGLSLSPKVIKEVGKVSLLTGLGQVLFTAVIGFFIARFLGLETISAMFVAIALTFSSTIIILKLLSDKGDIHALYGKVAIGFLLVQDIVATIILLIATSYAANSGDNLLLTTLLTLGKGVVVIAAVFSISSFLLPKLSKFIASSQELLFLFSLSFALGMGAIFSVIGFSVEIGALVAGVTLSITPYAYEVGSRLRPLRDFFILLFFILLGSQMIFANILEILFPAIVLSLFVLIGNPIIVIIIMNLLGFSKRTGFQAGLTVAQISEFSLILATLGFEIGSLTQEQLSLVTLVGLVTIAGSTYMILYSDTIYKRFEKLLSRLELKKNSMDKNSNSFHEAILFGYRRVGKDFIRVFEKLELNYMVVDYDPEAIKALEKENIPYRYGDAKDVEFLDELTLKKLKYVVTTIPEFETNILLVKKLRHVNKRVLIIVIAQTKDECLRLYNEGASYVLIPHYLGAQHGAKLMLQLGQDNSSYKEARNKHIRFLETRTI
jgi:Kef-type K+ transport system membrane component KefB